MKKSSFYLLFLFSMLTFLGCKESNKIFIKKTDVATLNLNGRVKILVTHVCSLDTTAAEHCSVYRREYDTRGFLVIKSDTSGSDFFTSKYFYNEDGLLDKVVFSSNAPFTRSEEMSYLYSFKELKKTGLKRRGTQILDSFVSLYDKNGNEIESSSPGTKTIRKYDERNFLVWDKFTRAGETLETNYVNDDKGRVLKNMRSDGVSQTFVYNEDGNVIKETSVFNGNKKDYFTGYCEFDKNGNYLKSITLCPQTKEMSIKQRVIEYY